MMQVYEKSYREVIEDLNDFGKRRKKCLFLLDFEQERGYFIPDPMGQSDVLFSINGISNASETALPDAPTLIPSPISYGEYKEKFDIVTYGLRRGDTFLCNLTVSTPIHLNTSLRNVFFATQARYKVYVPGRFVCFSPEIFVTIDAQGQIASHPMKGTIDASIPNAEELILNDYKETAEHNTIVDLIRNDLNIVSEKVHVERFRYIDQIRLPNGGGLLQVSSKIVGQLTPNFHDRLGSIIDLLLPAGSISGAPKEATIAIIKKAEGQSRGYYTGIVGYYDGNMLDTGVLIRFIEEGQGGQTHFRSGGGITINSHPEEEYKEVIQKVYIPTV